MKTGVEMDGCSGLPVNVVCVHHLMYNVFVSSGETDVCLLPCLVLHLFSDLLQDCSLRRECLYGAMKATVNRCRLTFTDQAIVCTFKSYMNKW